jgi:hypothetical protein
VLESVDATEPVEFALLRRTPLIAAAAVSVVTVIVMLPWLVLLAFVVGAVGVGLSTRARTAPSAVRASRVLSIGFGLAVGPAVYMLLATVVAAAG